MDKPLWREIGWNSSPSPSPSDIAAPVNATNAFAVPTRLTVYSVSSLLLCPFSSPSLFGQDKRTSASFDFSEKSVREVDRRERKESLHAISGSNELNFLKSNSNPWFKLRYRETLANYRFSLSEKWLYFRYTRRDERLSALFIVIRRGDWERRGAKKVLGLSTFRKENYSQQNFAWQLYHYFSSLHFSFAFVAHRKYRSSFCSHVFPVFEIFQQFRPWILGIKEACVSFTPRFVSSGGCFVLFSIAFIALASNC